MSFQSVGKSGGVGVEAFKPIVVTIGAVYSHSVDGANLVGGAVDVVEKGDDGFLVGYGDIEAVESIVVDKFCNLIDVGQLIELVMTRDSHTVKFLVEIKFGKRVRKSFAYEAQINCV